METDHNTHWARPVVKYTRNRLQDDQFEVFQKQAAKSGDPLSSHKNPSASEDFIAEFGILRTANIGIGYRKSGPVLRSNPPLGSTPKRQSVLQLFVLIYGHAFVKAQGELREVKAGSLCLMSTDISFLPECTTPHTIVGVSLPERVLSLASRDLRPLFFTDFLTSQNFAPLLPNAIKPIFLLDRADERGMEAYVLGLVELILRTEIGFGSDEAEPADMTSERRHQVEQFVRDNIADKNLGARAIASALHISPRLVYQLFEDHVESLNELIQRERVEHVTRILATSGRKRIPLDQLAAQTGFGSKRTLVRAFQKLYGCTPSHYACRHGYWV